MTITFADAIKKINPNAEFTCPNDKDKIDNIIWHNNTTPILKTEILTKQTELQTTYDDELSKKATDKASANDKLKALGLTDDEIKAIKS